MEKSIQAFAELSKEDFALAGGKGGVLARLWQAGYPVPDGFVILPAAFEGDLLAKQARAEVQARLARLRSEYGNESGFAVRSSALSEDSADASFGGQFDTVLDVRTDEAVLAAIRTVRASRRNERVQSYSKAKGMDATHEIAVVVQRLVRADLSGVLFTADPVSGSLTRMNGNYIYGLGDELVSGEAEPFTFTFDRPKGSYSGPRELKKDASKLFKLAARLEREFGCPQDIEWCIGDGKLYILQSRPITTLQEYEPLAYNWNSSRTGDYLWVQMDVYPEVFTPSSWSLWKLVFNRKIAGTSVGGNIAGRVYMNYSLTYSMLRKFGRSHQDTIDYLMVTLGTPPKDIEIPVIPLTFKQIFAHTSLSEFLDEGKRRKSALKFLAAAPAKGEQLAYQVKQTLLKRELAALWKEQVQPFFWDCFLTQSATNEEYINPYVALKKALARLMGEEKALEFIASIGGGSEELSSIGMTSGLGKVIHGEMSPDEYVARYGHRHANENEIAAPRPCEDPEWLKKRLEAYKQDPGDTDARIARRNGEFQAEMAKLANDFPRQARKIQKQIAVIRQATQIREAFRSELTRAIGVVRDWFLQAAFITGAGDDIFFLTYEEVLDYLAGDHSALQYVPERRKVYDTFRALPPYPGWIRGRFDPVQWTAEPNRRMDYFDAGAPVRPGAESEIVKGYAGSVGRVEGIVRIISSPEEGHLLQPGEILVAVTTNIGWTPLFPRAGAIVTDIGAPLAHAAIVARELGIPAVVGCGNATLRLKTGDRVRVDGGHGIVEILASE